MNKKEAHNWILKEMERWQNILHLGDINLNLEYTDKCDAMMESITKYPYKEIMLRYHDSMIKQINEDKEYSKRVVLHEMIHHITDPLYCKSTNRYIGRDELEDEREALTDRLTNIIYQIKNS